MKRYIKQGEMLRPFYGLAYWDYQRNVGVCYPLGVNLIVILYIDFIRWLRDPRQTR